MSTWLRRTDTQRERERVDWENIGVATGVEVRGHTRSVASVYWGRLSAEFAHSRLGREDATDSRPPRLEGAPTARARLAMWARFLIRIAPIGACACWLRWTAGLAELSWLDRASSERRSLRSCGLGAALVA